MNHSTWKSARSRRLAAEESTEEYEKAYEEAGLAFDLGQMVYDRRTELGLTQTELAERAGMKQPAISRIEGGGTVPTVPLLRRLAKALNAELTLSFTPHAEPEATAAPTAVEAAVEEAVERDLPVTAEGAELDEAAQSDQRLLIQLWVTHAFTHVQSRGAELFSKRGPELGAPGVSSEGIESLLTQLLEGWEPSPSTRGSEHLDEWLMTTALLRADRPRLHRFWRDSAVVRTLSREPHELRTRLVHDSVEALSRRVHSMAEELEQEAERLADA